MGPDLNLKPLQRGMQGFQQACEIRLADLRIGRMDYGGASQRGWLRVSLTGQGCEWVDDWDEAEAVMAALPRSEPKRVDLALTTWDGEVTHDRVVDAHSSGGFCSGGRPPALQQIISSDQRAGRTAYAGKRESDKFFRGYEKGFEMLAKLGLAGRDVTHIHGHPVEGIYRCEVELKAKTRPIPWELIGQRDQYFAGCYPFLAELMPEVQCDILMRRPERAPQIDLAAMLDTIRLQYGSALFTALVAHDGDICAVWDKIVGRTHHEELLAAGVLLVEHPEAFEVGEASPFRA
jgi:DNA relaxase NicK